MVGKNLIWGLDSRFLCGRIRVWTFPHLSCLEFRTMPLTEAKQKTVAKLVKMYVTPSGRLNPWFSRKLNQEPPEVRDAVWKEIREKNLDEKRNVLHTRFRVDKDEIAEPDENGRSKNIMWTDEEWDKLADFVHRARRKSPVPSIGTHIKNAMPQFPEDRRRNLTTNNIDPLLDRLQQKDQEAQEALEVAPRLKDKIAQLEQRPDKATILQNLTDEEIRIHLRDRIIAAFDDETVLRLFKQQVIENLSPDDVLASYDLNDLLACVPTSALVGYAATRILEQFESGASGMQEALMAISVLANSSGKKTVPVSTPQPSRPQSSGQKVQIKKPKIAILGMKPNQARIVEHQVDGNAEIIFVPKDMKANSVKTIVADTFILWGSFCSHQDQVHVKARAQQLGAKFVLHHGGMAKFLEKIEEETKLAAA